MADTLIILGIISLFEFVVWLPLAWHRRNLFIYPILFPIAILSGVVFYLKPNVYSAAFMLVGIYRSFNLYRIIKMRMHERYLYSVTRRASISLMLEQLILLSFLYLLGKSQFTDNRYLQIIVTLQLLLAITIFLSLIRHIRITREPQEARSYSDKDLPTLTVAVPARNETEDLELCLTSLLNSDYPKLEILVLDDCSQNARTPEIIRSYAHDGVRFVAGEEPSDIWLAKNLAYEKLREEANGELLLFCGVDTRFYPDSLRRVVATLIEKDKTMLSIMPLNTNLNLKASLIQPVRYAWELALPRALFQRPPVLSTCWIIKASALANAGGFKAVSRSIVPESYFARTTARSNGYAFIRASYISSDKNFVEQKATAIRMRYPQLHRRPEQVAAITLLSIFGLLGPFAMLPFALYQKMWMVATCAALCCITLMAIYTIIVMITYRKLVVYAPLLMPLAALYDIGLMNISMIKYELSEVIWKGRNVCVPVMHVVSSLPKLS